MPADFVIVQGDTEPVFGEQLEYSNGEHPDLTGATVTFVMRALTDERPLALTGKVNVLEAAKARINYAPSAADSAVPANYMANWDVVFAGGEKQTFPTSGYLWVQVQENLTTPGGAQIIGLPEVKDQLQVPANDHAADLKLTRWIAAVRPLVENITGPIIPEVHDEWYGGGHSTISLRHKPQFGPGTSPVLQLMAVSEYRGPIEYNLAIIANPTQGSIYSCMLNAELGLVVRRTAGGGTMPFWHDPEHGDQTVHITYMAGQKTVPANVTMAIEETLKWWWDTTQPQGKGFMTSADEEQQGRPGVALPYHAEAMLWPTARGPSVA
jgi:hypothetical protein